jgi:hypothetical protein
MSTTTTTPLAASALALLETKTLAGTEAGQSRPVVVGKTCVYRNNEEYYSQLSDAEVPYFHLAEVDANGRVVLCYSRHEYWISPNTSIYAPRFTADAAELATLLDKHTEEGVFHGINQLRSLKRLR